jgi:dihydroorotate dehydrogenase/Pyruvate/2-oxoacid:ferredoxin oxidoreductase delta subunit
MADLSTNFCGVRVKNPLVLGAGPLSGTAERIRKCIDAGYGAVCTKTASQFEYYHKFPYPQYNLVGYEKTGRGKNFRDWMWFHNDHNSPVGPLEFTRIVKDVADYARKKDCLLVGSFAASSIDEWARCAKAYQKAGAGAIELNFCCAGPGSLKDIVKEGDKTACYGDVLGRNVQMSSEIVKKVRSVIDIPILCKLPPGIRMQSKETAALLHDAGADGVELYANTKGMRVDIESATPVGFGCGTVNTHGHLADTMYDVAQLVAEYPEISVMAGRGVRRWEDAVEMLMAGATVVEICTTAFVYGLSFGQEILTDINQFMERKGYARIDDLKGKALKKALKPSEIKDKVTPVFAKVTGSKCKACGRCEEVCAYLAAKVLYKSGVGVAKIDKNRCVGCTLCSQVCPYDAISLPERTQAEYLQALLSVHPEAKE